MTAKQRRTHPSLYSHMVDSVSSGEGVGIGITNSISTDIGVGVI